MDVHHIGDARQRVMSQRFTGTRIVCIRKRDRPTSQMGNNRNVVNRNRSNQHIPICLPWQTYFGSGIIGTSVLHGNTYRPDCRPPAPKNGDWMRYSHKHRQALTETTTGHRGLSTSGEGAHIFMVLWVPKQMSWLAKAIVQ